MYLSLYRSMSPFLHVSIYLIYLYVSNNIMYPCILSYLYLYQSIDLLISLNLCIYLSIICLSVCLSVYLSVYLHLSICVCLPVCLSYLIYRIYLSVDQISVYLSYLSYHLCIKYLKVYLINLSDLSLSFSLFLHLSH